MALNPDVEITIFLHKAMIDYHVTIMSQTQKMM